MLPEYLTSYECQIKNHIAPALGAIRLETLAAHMVQNFYNSLELPRNGKSGLSPKSIKNIHGILHRALQQAVTIGYIRFNPADACVVPRVEHKELKPLDENDIVKFMGAIKGHRYETVFLVTLFTGMREGEVLGLTWDCVDFNRGTITVNKQLQKALGGGSVYNLVPTKNGRGRVMAPAPYVMELLKLQHERQEEWRVAASPLWENDAGLVFSDERGKHLSHHTVYKNYKRVVASIGLPASRFHDLRACLTSPRARLGGIFSALTALKILAIRQDYCGFLPCRTKTYLANPHTLRY